MSHDLEVAVSVLAGLLVIYLSIGVTLVKLRGIYENGQKLKYVPYPPAAKQAFEKKERHFAYTWPKHLWVDHVATKRAMHHGAGVSR